MEEELSTEEVLASIKQMLNSELVSTSGKAEQTRIPDAASSWVDEPDDFFLLTPEMRVDVPRTDQELSETIHKRTQQVLNKLHRLQQQPPTTQAVAFGEKQASSAFSKLEITPDELQRIISEAVAKEIQKLYKRN